MKKLSPTSRLLRGLTEAANWADWPSSKKVLALSFLAAALPLGVGVAILLAPGERAAVPAVAASFVVVALVLIAGLVGARRLGPRPVDEEAASEGRALALFGSLSHELRTPLNSIIGFSELLVSEAAGKLSPRHQQYLDDVLGSGRQLLVVVNDLLDLTQIETGVTPLLQEVVAPADVLADAVAGLGEEAEAREVELVVVSHARQKVSADRSSVARALHHLIATALRFSPAGARVEVSSEDIGASVRFTVVDQGPGLDLSLLPGNGLGLILSRRLLAGNGGRLDIESERGRGTTFRGELPAATPPTRGGHLVPFPRATS